MQKRSPLQQEPRPRLRIDFNRKILSHKVLQTLRDTVAEQGHVSGSAIQGVVDDLQKLRYLCENIIGVYDTGDVNKTLEGLQMLKMVL